MNIVAVVVDIVAVTVTVVVVVKLQSQVLRLDHVKHRFLGTFRTDSDCNSDICPRNIYPQQEYLNCYWPDLVETLKVASWEHLEQIQNIKLTFVQATVVLVTSVHIKNISAVTDPILIKI